MAIVVLGVIHHGQIPDYYTITGDAMLLFYVNNFQSNMEDNLIAQSSYGKWLGGATIYLANFYVIMNRFVDFIFVIKLIPVLTYLLAAIFMYRLGKLIKNRRYGLIAAFLFILHPMATRPFTDGMARSFAFLLLIAFLYYFIKKDMWKLSIVFLFQAMLYPASLLISLLTFGLSKIDLKEKKIKLDIKSNYVPYIFIIIALALVLIPMEFINYGIKENTPFNELILYPELYEGGKIQIFRGTIPFTSDVKSTFQSLIVIYDTSIRRPFHTNNLFILLLLTIISIAIYRKKIFKLPTIIYLMLLSGFILQSLAALLLFRLHMPARFVWYTVPIILILTFAHGMYFLSINKKTRHVFTILVLLLPLFFIPNINYVPTHCEDKEIYDYIKALPKDVLIAGHPWDMNCIALYGQRKPFIMSEANIPYYKDYYTIIRQRNFDFFSAYYSDSKLAVEELCKKEGITHIVTNKEYFDDKFLNKKRVFQEPFNSYIKNITQGKKVFYLQNPDNVLFESGNKTIISCGS